jgi:spermidine synthase
MLRSFLLFGLFFVSGFCALLYQVVWLRMAFAAFGVITPVLSVVISVFMAGLSLGSWLGGKWIGPLSHRLRHSAIYFYGLAELIVGVGAFAVPVLFRWGEALLRPAGGIDSGTYLTISAITITAAILPWCFAMGTTFPFMMAYIREFDRSNRTGFSRLYLANVIGAMAGAGLTAAVLIEIWGFSRTLLLAGSCNFAIALTSVLIGFVTRARVPIGEDLDRATAFQPEPPEARVRSRHVLVPAILFTTGLVSMAMEVIWTRAFTPILTTTIYAFAGLLVVYLLATWIGTSVHRLLLRVGRPIGNDRTLAFVALGALLPLLLPDPHVLPRKWAALASIFPLCAGLGYLTPKLIDEYALGHPRSVGRAYAWNIVGSILGPLCAGYLLLPTLGSKWSLVLLTVPLILLVLLIMRAHRVRAFTAILGASAVALMIYTSMKSTTYEDATLYPKAVVRRDHTATVISTDDGRRQRLLVNGVGITHKTPITKLMAHLPLSFHDGPVQEALVICFGMGTTMRSTASWGVKVTAVELVPSVVEAFDYYYPDAETFRQDPRVEIVVDDGRRFLKRTDRRFDVVTIDPPPPVETAGSSLLYSRDFYDLLKTRMADGGILQQWFPGGEDVILKGVAGALAESFPYVRAFRSYEGWGYHFLASSRPLPNHTAQEILARLPGRARRDLAEWVSTDRIPILFQRTLSNEVPLSRLVGRGDSQVITDDRPLNEYFLLRRWRGLHRAL